VAVTDLTSFDHIERVLALFKVNMANHDLDELKRVVASANARILDDHNKHYTIEYIGGSQDVDRVMERIAAIGELTTVVRGGAMAVARGAPVFGRATK
jgi:acetolactate synthase small subunit